MAKADMTRIGLLLGLLTAWAVPAWGQTAAPAPSGDSPWPPFKPIEVKGNVIRTARHVITVDPSGLPAQIEILPDVRELPLEHRGEAAGVPGDVLEAMGRGLQLRSPVRLEVQVGGKATAAVAAKPAAVIRQSPAAVEYASTLKVGPVDADLSVRYECDGAMTAKLTYSSGAKVQAMQMIVELGGPVDVAYPGLPADLKPDQAPPDKLDPVVPGGEGVVWDSAKGRPWATGPHVSYLHVGSGDRALTWLCDAADGLLLDAKAPAMTVERDKSGAATWRISFVNHETAVAPARTAAFALLIHPAKPREDGFRRVQWLAPRSGKDRAVLGKEFTPEAVDGVGRMSLAARERMKQALQEQVAKLPPAPVLIGPRTAAAVEAFGQDLDVAGWPCDAQVAPETLALSLPPAPLFRVLAGTATGLTARYRPGLAAAARSGDDPRPARSAIARALLHDVGLDLAGVDQPAHFAKVLNILKDFGCFDDDQTEVIPYWRSRPFVRYGEEFGGEGAFALSQKDPYENVRVTVYRRAVQAGAGAARGFKAMFIVANEGPEAVRERLFIVAPQRLFGGPNTVTGDRVAAAYDFSKIDKVAPGAPGGSWGASGIVRSSNYRALRDLEDDGLIKENRTKGRQEEVYGPLHVLAGDFRILYGEAGRSGPAPRPKRGG